jgi:large subunit ribosomal protein L29
MKKKELAELKTKSETELKKTLGELKDRLWDLKKDLAAGKVKNVREIREIKKNVARILTFLNAK